MPLYFKRKGTSNARFFPREKADKIPFSLKQLPNLLNFFSFAKGSEQAQAMEQTLETCEIPPITGETKFCPTSLESMLDFALGIFGISKSDPNGDHPILLTTTFLTSTTPNNEDPQSTYQNYTVLETPTEILASKMIGCHSMSYPYVVFYCHTQPEGEVKLYKILFGGDKGDKLEAVAVCHLNTSEWNPGHLSFPTLKIQRGAPVCHVFPPHDNLVWVHYASKASI